MRANKCGQWSKIGRLRRSKMPKLQSGPGGTGDSTFGERAVVAGRLMCDTYVRPPLLCCARVCVMLMADVQGPDTIRSLLCHM